METVSQPCHICLMEARDRYIISLKCPQCEREGIAHVSEDKSPFRNSGFLVDTVAEGFAVRKFAPSAIATEFECAICKCKVLVK
jgi:hypothetical protein